MAIFDGEQLVGSKRVRLPHVGGRFQSGLLINSTEISFWSRLGGAVSNPRNPVPRKVMAAREVHATVILLGNRRGGVGDKPISPFSRKIDAEFKDKRILNLSSQ